jgi:hypothetical protein
MGWGFDQVKGVPTKWQDSDRSERIEHNLSYEPSREGEEMTHEPFEIEAQAESKNESYRTPVSLLNTEKNL